LWTHIKNWTPAAGCGSMMESVEQLLINKLYSRESGCENPWIIADRHQTVNLVFTKQC
jgi:hypothetical protein